MTDSEYKYDYKSFNFISSSKNKKTYKTQFKWKMQNNLINCYV